jgi:hypothetical protein
VACRARPGRRPQRSSSASRRCCGARRPRTSRFGADRSRLASGMRRPAGLDRRRGAPAAAPADRLGIPGHCDAAGGLAFAGFCLALSTRGLGLGDCKLSASLGTLLGWSSSATLFDGALAGFVLAGTYGICLIAAGRGDGQRHIALGPFMIGSAFAIILFLSGGGPDCWHGRRRRSHGLPPCPQDDGGRRRRHARPRMKQPPNDPGAGRAAYRGGRPGARSGWVPPKPLLLGWPDAAPSQDRDRSEKSVP